MTNRTDFIRGTEALQDMLVTVATGGSAPARDYQVLRSELVSNPAIQPFLPRFIKTCDDIDTFWEFIRFEFRYHNDRREYIEKEFARVREKLEHSSTESSDEEFAEVLEEFDMEKVQQARHRALERRKESPEEAITAARVMLESVCRHILHDVGEEHTEKLDLPGLYELTAMQLSLHPSGHTEPTLRQLLAGGQGVADSLDSICRRFVDGETDEPIQPTPHHAELAVNLAGAIATFLVRTWQVRNESAE